MPNDAFAYFCGGPADGTCMEIRELTNNLSLSFPITDYAYSDDKVESAQGWLNVRIWHYVNEHEHSEAQYKGTLGYEGPVLLEQMWNELDALYMKFNNDNTLTQEKTDNLKGHMRGIAWCIALWMKPYFRTADDVVMEVHKRYTMSLDPEKEYYTPGLGKRRMEMPEGSKYSQIKSEPIAAPRHNLSDDKVSSIRKARDSGAFSNEELAGMYGVKAEVIASI